MARSFVQLSLDERRIIAQMNEKKISQAEIARRLGRDRSTICRELRRNFWHDQEVPIAEGYWHVTAHRLAAARRRQYRKLYCRRRLLPRPACLPRPAQSTALDRRRPHERLLPAGRP